MEEWARDVGQIGERDQRLPIPLTPSAPPLPPPAPGAAIPVGESPLDKVLPPKKKESWRRRQRGNNAGRAGMTGLTQAFGKLTVACKPLKWPSNKQEQEWVFLSPLQWYLHEARQAGEDISGFSLYPIFEQPDPQNPDQMLCVHQSTPFKTSELKTSSSMYGPTSVLGLLDTISEEAMAPSDWNTLAKACLSPGDYLLWTSNWVELSVERANRNQAHGVPITIDMLMGTRPHGALQAQLVYPMQAYQQIKSVPLEPGRSCQQKEKCIQL